MKKILLLAIACLLTACSGTTIHNLNYSPECKIGCFSRLAILPFNQTSKKNLEMDIVIDKFTVSLLNATQFKLVDRADIQKVFKEISFQVGGGDVIDDATKQRLKHLGADSILTGALHTYHEDRRNDRFVLASEVYLTAKIIKIETGEILWSGEILKKAKAKNLGQSGFMNNETEAASAKELLDDIVYEMSVAITRDTMRKYMPIRY